MKETASRFRISMDRIEDLFCERRRRLGARTLFQLAVRASKRAFWSRGYPSPKRNPPPGLKEREPLDPHELALRP